MKDKIFLFLIGFFSFSSFLSYWSVGLLNGPSLVEIFAIPLLYYYRHNLKIPQVDLIWVILFLVFGIIIGLSNPVFSLLEILPIARCFMLGAVAFIIAKNNNIFKDINSLYAFSFGVFMGDLLNAYLLMNSILGTTFDKQYAVDINVIFSVLWVILTILYKSSKYLIAIFVLVPLLSFISVSRGIATFFLIGVILAFVLKVYRRPSKIVITIAFLSISYFVLSSMYVSNEEAVRNYSPSMHFRLYKKVKSYGRNSIDKGRIAPYIWAVDNLIYYAVPRGFLGKKFLSTLDGDNTPMMAPWDSVYMELLYTFGFIPLMIILLIYLYKLYSCYVLYAQTGELIFAALCAMLSLLFIEFVFAYGLIRSPFMVVCNGGFLGFIWRITSQPKTLIGNLIPKKND